MNEIDRMVMLARDIVSKTTGVGADATVGWRALAQARSAKDLLAQVRHDLAMRIAHRFASSVAERPGAYMIHDMPEHCKVTLRAYMFTQDELVELIYRALREGQSDGLAARPEDVILLDSKQERSEP